LLFADGTEFSYSNTNYLVLGRIIETVTGEPYHDVMRARTITRAGLPATGLDGFDPPACGLVDGHLGQVKVVTHDVEPAWMWSAGGVVSTGPDLCAWVTALYLGDVLPEDDREAMMTPDPLSIGGSMRAYGYGTRYALRNGITVVGHTGSTMGFNAEVFLHLDSGVCVAVLTNDFAGQPRRVSEPAWALLAPYMTN
jgi:D-alanyl-D-alanine carboxypeptidase